MVSLREEVTTSILNVFAIYYSHTRSFHDCMGQTFGEVLHYYLCKFEVKIIRFTGLFCNLTIIVLGTFVASSPPFYNYSISLLKPRVRWPGQGQCSDPGTAVAAIPRHAARVDLPPARVHEVRGVQREAALEGRGARVPGVRPAHLPPDGRGRRLPGHEARRQLVWRRQ